MKGQTQTPQLENDSLGTAIGYSIVFHIVLVAVFVLRVVFFPSSPVLMQTAIRVDMVSLPDKTMKAPPADVGGSQKKPPKVAEPAPEPPKALPKIESPAIPPKSIQAPKPSNKISLDKAKHEEASALKRLEALERLEKMTTEQKHTAAAAPVAPHADTPSAVVKGNAISKGASLTGIAKLDNDNYVSTVTEKVKQNWNLPRWLSTSNLRAVVKVFIDASGNIIKKQLVLSSNNETFDERVMSAIESAAPYPPPPEDLASRLSVYGFELDLSP